MLKGVGFVEKPAVFMFGRIQDADNHKETVGRLPAIVQRQK